MQHLVGSDILQSSLSYHTHIILQNLSLEGVSHCGKRVPGTGNKGRRSVLTKRELSKTTVFFCLWVLEACGRQACFNLLRVLGKDMPRMLPGGRLCASRHTPCKCPLRPVVNVSLMAPLDGWLTMHPRLARILPQRQPQ